MTGHGRGAAEVEGRRVTVEVTSVNHRFLDVKVRARGEGARLDEVLLAAVRRRADRGSFTFIVRDDLVAGRGAAVRVDPAAARAAHAALEELRELLGYSEPPPLALVAAQPGVLVLQDVAAEDDGLAAVNGAVDAALLELVAMRRREGAVLAVDLLERLGRLETWVEEIAGHAAVAPGELRRRFAERLERLLQPTGAALDETRLAAEVAILADRADVTEELVRLRAHLAALRALTSDDVAVGRRMDFLVQEVGREINTIGSKAQSIEISRRIVDAKAELEKIREQVQNVE